VGGTRGLLHAASTSLARGAEATVAFSTTVNCSKAGNDLAVKYACSVWRMLDSLVFSLLDF
jgi:hypothetical protein